MIGHFGSVLWTLFSMRFTLYLYRAYLLIYIAPQSSLICMSLNPDGAKQLAALRPYAAHSPERTVTLTQTGSSGV